MTDDAALKDGNRIPTLLFEENGEVRRVSNIKPLPVAVAGDALINQKTVSLQISGTGQQAILTPALGKKLIVRGAAILHQPATAGESILRFQGGKVIHKTFRSDHSGSLIPMNQEGLIDEPLIAETTGFSGGQMAFFVVNYQEP